ncbi:MAG: DegV family protein [Coriobacteriia bacterium]|nr:DegV family protein [Coriobacteriia bacterium]
MGRIGIVSDSTCDLGPAWFAENDVVMVPLKVTFDDDTYLDWTDLRPDDFYDMLGSASTLPKTSQPSPADFGAVYRDLADQGCTGIVSIHLTEALSGTIESARMAAKMAPVPVRVVNTRIVSAGEALILSAALDARAAGADLDGVERAAQRVVDDCKLLFALDTLHYLVKGGRAGKAQGLAASMLNIKPVLTFNSDGIIEPFKKLKGSKKAYAEIATQVALASADGPVALAIFHSRAPELADELLAAIDRAGARYELVHMVTVGAVIGTYAGPRAVGAAFYRLP